jgi:hypothetical protein
MVRALRVHRLAIEHARLADREVGDVDHLLHFAVTLGLDLAHLERHEAAERVLVLTQLFADETHDLAALRRGHEPPLLERGARIADELLVVGRRGGLHLGDQRAARRAARFDDAAVAALRPGSAGTRRRIDCLQVEGLEDLSYVFHRVYSQVRASFEKGILPIRTGRSQPAGAGKGRRVASPHDAPPSTRLASRELEHQACAAAAGLSGCNERPARAHGN